MGDPETPNPSKKLPQYLAALAATGGAFAAGTTLGWSSPTMSKLVTKNESKEEYDYIITEQEFAWVGSLVTLGAAIVCLFIGPVIQILGRKLTMLLDIIPFTLGWLLVIISGFVKNSLAMLYIGRILLGISGGAFCVAAPTYTGKIKIYFFAIGAVQKYKNVFFFSITGEIAQPSIRGALGSFFQLMLVIGILFVYAVGPYVSVVVLSSICATIPIIFGLIFIWMPESPTFLISKGKTEEAIKSLKWLRGNQYDYSNELAELQAQDEADKKNKVSLVAALKRRSTIKAILIGMGLMFFQQMSGINAVIFFSEDIFKAAKSNEEGGLKAAEETIIVGVMQVVAVFVSSIIVDKLGRRWLLLPSIIVMGICNILLGTYFFLEDKTSIGWLPITSLCIFIILFSLGFGMC